MFVVAFSALILAPGCQPADDNAGHQSNDTGLSAAEAQAQAQARGRPIQQPRDRARREAGPLGFVVDKSDRKVRVYRDRRALRTLEVAVGVPNHETPTGSWAFTRVDINPEWIPPQSDWAEGRVRSPPGDPDNPMGRARLVFDLPYTIHGTEDLESLGTAASHGSIRVSNEDALALAELLLRAGGAWEGREWFREMAENRNFEYEICLPQPVPISVQE